MSAPVVLFDYDASPYGLKIRWLLTATGIDFKRVDQPPVLPRPDLEKLGITYRRIPVLAVGKDVYADSAAIIDVILNKLGGKDKIATTPADKAYEIWGNSTFAAVLPLIPKQGLTEVFVKDRKTIFPLLKRPDFDTLAPSATAEFQSRMAYVEDILLADSPYVGGDKLSLADIHVIWPIRWALFGIGARHRPGCGKDSFPKVWSLIESLPKPKFEVLSSEDGVQTILNASLTAGEQSVMSGEALQLSAGTQVTVESMDSAPGSHPQAGKLIGSARHEIVLQLESGVQLHYPRIGYIVREVGAAKL